MSNEIPFKVDVPPYRTIVNGVWSDIQNSWIASFDYSSSTTTEVRVNVKNDAELAKTLQTAQLDNTILLKAIYRQLKLMNARIEEAFNTTLDEVDVR